MESSVLERPRPFAEPAAAGTARFGALRWAVCTLALGGYLFVAAACGASLGQMLSFFVCAVGYLVLPGMALAHYFDLDPQRREPALRPLAALLYGCGFLALTYCVAARLGMLWLLRGLPPLAAALWLAGLARRSALPGQATHCAGAAALARQGLLDAAKERLWANGVVLWALLCLFYALTMGAMNAHPLRVGFIDLNRDLLWNVGNASAFCRAFPAQDIRFSGVRFSYHYLTEMLVAALSLVSGAPCYDIYVFFAGPVFLAGELAALCALGRCYYGDARRAHGLVYMLFGFQCLSMWGVAAQRESLFANTLLKHLVTNINSQATALIFLCVFTGLFTHMARRGFAVGPVYLLAFFASFFLLSFAKGPQAAIVLCSFAITMAIVLLFQRPRYGRALLCMAGPVVLFAGIYRFLYASGANNSMVFSIFSMENSLPYRTLSPYADWLCAHLPVSGYVWLAGIGIVNVFCMMPFQFLLWLRGVPGALRRLSRLDPARILANGVVVGGFLAYHIFWHSSSSQAYFALVSMIYMTLLAVEQLDPALRQPVWGWLCRAAGAAAAFTTLMMVLVYGGQGAAQLWQDLGLREPVYTTARATAADEEAMLWLASNSGSGVVFATNRTSSTPENADGISNLYTAMSGRQAYMEGWTYAVTNMGVDAAVVEQKQAVNAALFSGCLTAEELAALCGETGVNCLVYARQWPGEPPQGIEPVFENPEIAIYLVNQPQGEAQPGAAG